MQTVVPQPQVIELPFSATKSSKHIAHSNISGPPAPDMAGFALIFSIGVSNYGSQINRDSDRGFLYLQGFCDKMVSIFFSVVWFMDYDGRAVEGVERERFLLAMAVAVGQNVRFSSHFFATHFLFLSLISVLSEIPMFGGSGFAGFKYLFLGAG